MIPDFLNTLPSFMKSNVYANAVSDSVTRSIPKYYLEMVSSPTISSLIAMSEKYDAITSNMMRILDNSALNLVRNAAKFNAPSSVLSALNSIQSHHEKFAHLFQAISTPFQFLDDYSHNWNSLFQAYNKSISHIVSTSLREKEWDEVKNIEELEATLANFPSPTEDLAYYYDQANKWFANVLVKLTEMAKKHIILITLIGLMYKCWEQYKSDFGYYKDSQVQEQPALLNSLATKEDITCAIETLKLEIEQNNSNKVVTSFAKVYFKPNNKSKVLDSLIESDKVIVLQTNHKWVLISYTKSGDDICTGWVLKKYTE